MDDVVTNASIDIDDDVLLFLDSPSIRVQNIAVPYFTCGKVFVRVLRGWVRHHCIRSSTGCLYHLLDIQSNRME